MLAEIDRLKLLFCCPRTRVPLIGDGAMLRCVDDDRCSYSSVQGAPVLIDFARSILSAEEVTENNVDSPVRRRVSQGLKRAVKRILSPEKKSTRRNIERLIAALPRDRVPLVLVIGGGTIGQGMRALYEHPELEIAAFD